MCARCASVSGRSGALGKDWHPTRGMYTDDRHTNAKVNNTSMDAVMIWHTNKIKLERRLANEKRYNIELFNS
jgi:hypothetical protein